MSRLNITIPDALYERLELLRDRINLSKVCATALEKEVAMLEGQAKFNDPRIGKLMQRLQGSRERWYQRGRQDGIDWAVEKATREELELIFTWYGTQDGSNLAMLFQHPVHKQMQPPMPPMPPHTPRIPLIHSFPPRQAGPGSHEGFAPMPPGPPAFEIPHFPMSQTIESFPLRERLAYWRGEDQENGAKGGDVDEGAYLEGWRDAIKEIWQTIASSL